MRLAATIATVLVSGGQSFPIDARTLERDSRSVPLVSGPRVFEASPDGKTLAVSDGGMLRFIDVATWTLEPQAVPVPGTLGIYWTEKGRLLVTTGNGDTEQAAVYVIDPDRPAPLARRPLDHTAMDGQKVGDYYAVLDSDQRQDLPDKDNSVVRIYSAGGRQLHVVRLGSQTGDDELRALTAFGGKLYVGAGRHFFRIDPKTGKRTSFRAPGKDYIYGWLAVSKRHLVGDGIHVARHRGTTTGFVFNRRTGALVRSVASPSEQRGFGSGWVSYAFPRSGLTGYDANGTRRWRTLRGVDFNGVDHVRGYLYVRSLDDPSVLTRAIDKRTGRVTGRLRGPLTDQLVAADSDGEIVNSLGDFGDESDT